MSFDFESYQYGIYFLKKWWKASGNTPRGDSAFQAVLNSYGDEKIASIGKKAKNVSGHSILGTDLEDRVIGYAVSDKMSKAPTQAEWNLYFSEEAGNIDEVKAILTGTADGLKQSLEVATDIGKNAIYLYVGIAAIGLALALYSFRRRA